jgi:hypothetical protein
MTEKLLREAAQNTALLLLGGAFVAIIGDFSLMLWLLLVPTSLALGLVFAWLSQSHGELDDLDASQPDRRGRDPGSDVPEERDRPNDRPALAKRVAILAAWIVIQTLVIFIVIGVLSDDLLYFVLLGLGLAGLTLAGLVVFFLRREGEPE